MLRWKPPLANPIHWIDAQYMGLINIAIFFVDQGRGICLMSATDSYVYQHVLS